MSEPRHASIRLIPQRCTACYICARECPSWCISIEAHAEVPDAPAPGVRRPRAEPVLDRFELDFSDCMYCGICVEECPFDALEWSDALLPAPDVRGRLVLGRDDLAALPGAAEGGGSAA